MADPSAAGAHQDGAGGAGGAQSERTDESPPPPSPDLAAEWWNIAPGLRGRMDNLTRLDERAAEGEQKSTFMAKCTGLGVCPIQAIGTEEAARGDE